MTLTPLSIAYLFQICYPRAKVIRHLLNMDF